MGDKPSTFNPSAHTLGSHSDVTLASLANGNILRYNGSRWVNNTLAQAGIATPADITNAIGGIEIGGRNIVLDTSKPPNYRTSTTRARYMVVSEHLNRLGGEEVTISFELKSNASSHRAYIYDHSTAAYAFPQRTVSVKDNSWNKYTFTETIDSSTLPSVDPSFTFIINPGDGFEVRNLQVEKGNKATP